jgi:NAD dependent epimerase/dehydratase
MTVWKGRPVLVTGASGFIGSHLVEKLVEQGATVRALVHYNSRSGLGALEDIPNETLARIEIVRGDLLDSWSVFEAVRDTEVIFHLGALIAIPYSYENPVHVVQTNVLGTTHVLQAARQFNVARILHVSTSEVYGTARYVPINEEHPLQGQSPYSASKIGAEKIAESYYCAYDLPVAIVRAFNTYGPRQSTRAVIPTIITQALSLEQITLGNLTPTRDLTFVTDTANGFMKAADPTNPHAVGRVINIGNGQEISVGALANKILQLIGREMPVVSNQQRVRPENSEVERLICDNSAAQTYLQWKPSVSLEEGLQRTIDWMQLNQNLYQPDKYQI